MPTEIERKFLIDVMPELDKGIKSKVIKQRYLSRGGEKGKITIMVKYVAEKAFLRIRNENAHAEKKQYEYEVPPKEALELTLMLKKLGETKSPTIRIRQLGDEGLFTIKGEKSGLEQPEYEYSIPLKDALELFELCEPGMIEKTRYYIPHGNHVIELDVFGGDNKGLILAEIELKSKNDTVEIPAWFGKEVTHDKNYSNASLSMPKLKVNSLRL